MSRKIFPILIIALFLRFIALNKAPVCLSNDEAAYAYNAFSILTTGKDEYGKPFPMTFTSIGDAKPPLAVYLTTLPVKIWGLTETSVRIPPAITGVFAVVMVYFLSLALTKNKSIALWTSLFLAISPWHIVHSRSFFDVGLAFALVIFSTWLFLLGVKKRPGLIVLSLVGFSLSVLSYHSERLFVPLFIAGLFVIFKDNLLKVKKDLFLPLALSGFVFVLMYTYSFLSPESSNKAVMTSLLSYERPLEEQKKIKSQDSPIVYSLVHSRPVEITHLVVRRYLNHFSPSFLFSSGTSADPKQAIFGMGEMYLFQIPLLIIGLINIKRLEPKNRKVVFLWLILSPLPAAITRDEMSGRRALELLTPLTILSAIGANKLVALLTDKVNSYKLLIRLAFFAVALYNLGFFLISYFVFTPYISLKPPSGWGCSYKQLVHTISSIQAKYKNIIIDTTYQTPYLFFLFYQGYPPYLYQPQARLVFEPNHNLGESPGFDNLEFRSVNWRVDKEIINGLLAVPPEKIPIDDIKSENIKPIDTIKFPNGETAFFIIETSKEFKP